MWVGGVAGDNTPGELGDGGTMYRLARTPVQRTCL
jgi:hypothetical protein